MADWKHCQNLAMFHFQYFCIWKCQMINEACGILPPFQLTFYRLNNCLHHFLSRPTGIFNTMWLYVCTLGWTMTVTLGARSLSILVTVPGLAWKNTRGLLGVYNADPTDDLTTRNGTILPLDSSASDIYYQFGLPCKKQFF